MKLNVVFEDLQPENVFIISLFSMEHSCVLTVKIIPGVHNSLWFLHGKKELL